MNHFIQHDRWNPASQDDTSPFSNVVDLAHHRHAQMAPEDRFTHLNKHAYASIEGRNALAALRGDSAGNQFLAHLRDHAFDQLCARIAPTRNFGAYARACPPNLRVLNLNHWIHSNGDKKDVLLRVAHGCFQEDIPQDMPVIRAILSDRYEPFDDLQLVEALEGLPRINDARVRWLDISETSSHFRITWPEERTAIKVGDVVKDSHLKAYVAVHLSSTEQLGHEVKGLSTLFGGRNGGRGSNETANGPGFGCEQAYRCVGTGDHWITSGFGACGT